MNTDTTPKIIAPPEAALLAAEQPTYPRTNITIAPDGMTIVTLLGPDTSFNKFVGEEAMNQICRQWLETRKAVRDQMETIRAVQKSRVN